MTFEILKDDDALIHNYSTTRRINILKLSKQSEHSILSKMAKPIKAKKQHYLLISSLDSDVKVEKN